MIDFKWFCILSRLLGTEQDIRITRRQQDQAIEIYNLKLERTIANILGKVRLEMSSSGSSPST